MGREFLPEVSQELEDDANFDGGEDQMLRAAFEASLQSLADDELRRAAEDAQPLAWRRAAPICNDAIQSKVRKGAGVVEKDPPSKDPADVPPTLEVLKRSAAPRSPKRARHAFVEDDHAHMPSLSERTLAVSEAVELWQLLFGSAGEEGDIDRWFRSTFAFAREALPATDVDAEAARSRLACPWGLRQELGGPCGVLAALQAFIVRELLWSSAEDHVDSASQASTRTGTESDAEVPAPEVAAAPDRTDTAIVAVLAERFYKSDPQDLLACAIARMLYATTPASRYVWAEVADRYGVVQREFATMQALATWLVASGALESSPCPVLSLVCSLVLTRGIDQILSDMDDANASLVGIFGHCSQELVNLCLVGRATTNVFDGNVTFEDQGDAITLQGIQDTPAVGFLSALEPMKYCEVGNLLKRPSYPLWVIGSQSHYALLLAGDCRLNHAEGDEAPSGSTAQLRRCGACQGNGDPCGKATVFFYNGRDSGAAEQPTLSAVEVRPHGAVGAGVASVLSAASAVQASLDAGGLDSSWTAELGIACAPLAEVSAELRDILQQHGWEASQFRSPPDRAALLGDLRAAARCQRSQRPALLSDDDGRLFAEVLRTRWPAAEIASDPATPMPRLY